MLLNPQVFLKKVKICTLPILGHPILTIIFVKTYAMGTIQIKFKTAEQWKQMLRLFQELKIEYQIVEAEEFIDHVADNDQNDTYQASLLVLSDDWDDPANDHWNTL